MDASAGSLKGVLSSYRLHPIIVVGKFAALRLRVLQNTWLIVMMLQLRFSFEPLRLEGAHFCDIMRVNTSGAQNALSTAILFFGLSHFPY